MISVRFITQRATRVRMVLRQFWFNLDDPEHLAVYQYLRDQFISGVFKLGCIVVGINRIYVEWCEPENVISWWPI